MIEGAHASTRRIHNIIGCVIRGWRRVFVCLVSPVGHTRVADWRMMILQRWRRRHRRLRSRLVRRRQFLQHPLVLGELAQWLQHRRIPNLVVSRHHPVLHFGPLFPIGHQTVLQIGDGDSVSAPLLDGRWLPFFRRVRSAAIVTRTDDRFANFAIHGDPRVVENEPFLERRADAVAVDQLVQFHLSGNVLGDFGADLVHSGAGWRRVTAGVGAAASYSLCWRWLQCRLHNLRVRPRFDVN